MSYLLVFFPCLTSSYTINTFVDDIALVLHSPLTIPIHPCTLAAASPSSLVYSNAVTIMMAQACSPTLTGLPVEIQLKIYGHVFSSRELTFTGVECALKNASHVWPLSL